MFEHNLSWKVAGHGRNGLAQDESSPPFTAHTALLDMTWAMHVYDNNFKTMSKEESLAQCVFSTGTVEAYMYANYTYLQHRHRGGLYVCQPKKI